MPPPTALQLVQPKSEFNAVIHPTGACALCDEAAHRDVGSIRRGCARSAHTPLRAHVRPGLETGRPTGCSADSADRRAPLATYISNV
jgi:hypothetical protein